MQIGTSGFATKGLFAGLFARLLNLTERSGYFPDSLGNKRQFPSLRIMPISAGDFESFSVVAAWGSSPIISAWKRSGHVKIVYRK